MLLFIGASNTVSPSYVDEVRRECAVVVKNVSHSGYGPYFQRTKLFPKVNHGAYSHVILDPSGNGANDYANYLVNLKKYVAVARSKWLTSKLLIVNLGPRTYATKNIPRINQEIAKLGVEVVDVYSVLSQGTGLCRYCGGSKKHWSHEGDVLVAKALLPYVCP